MEYVELNKLVDELGLEVIDMEVINYKENDK